LARCLKGQRRAIEYSLSFPKTCKAIPIRRIVIDSIWATESREETMVKTIFRLAKVIIALSAIFITWTCSGHHKELQSYPSVKHLSVSSVVNLAAETMQKMGYRTSNENGNGNVFGIKRIGFRRFEMAVEVVSDSQSDMFLNVKCAVISNQVENMSSLSEKGNIEVQKFHKLFGAIAEQSELPSGKVPKAAPVATPLPEQEPKGFE